MSKNMLVNNIPTSPLFFQAADAVYDAKYKQLATSPACRKPGLQDLMQYDINT